MYKPSHFFKALSDETRLRCLLLLTKEQELCVCELVEALDVSQPLVSRHLANLRSRGIVDDERRGQWVYYRLHPDLPSWAREVLDIAYRPESDAGNLATAERRLAAMLPRPKGRCD